MGRRQYRRRGTRRYFKRSFGGGLQKGWFRTGELTDGMALSASTQEIHSRLVTGLNMRPDRTLPLAMAGKSSTMIYRILLRVVPTVANFLAATMVKYWFGIRVQEVLDDGSIPTWNSSTTPSLEMQDSGDRRENWWWRDSVVFVTPATAALTLVLPEMQSDKFTVDVKPNRRLEDRMALTFQHRWEVVGGGGPDGNLSTAVSADILVGLPRG